MLTCARAPLPFKYLAYTRLHQGAADPYLQHRSSLVGVIEDNHVRVEIHEVDAQAHQAQHHPAATAASSLPPTERGMILCSTARTCAFETRAPPTEGTCLAALERCPTRSSRLAEPPRRCGESRYTPTAAQVELQLEAAPRRSLGSTHLREGQHEEVSNPGTAGAGQ